MADLENTTIVQDVMELFSVCGFEVRVKSDFDSSAPTTVYGTIDAAGVLVDALIEFFSQPVAPALTDEQIKAIPQQIGLLVSSDGKYMRSLGTHGGLTVEDGIAFVRAALAATTAADGQDALDAKRYRYLRNSTEFTDDVDLALGDMLGLDSAIDAAIAAKETT